MYSRAEIQLRIKYHLSSYTCCAGGAAVTPKAPRILPAAPTGLTPAWDHSTSWSCQVLSSGDSSHLCPCPGATPAPKQPQHQQELPLSPGSSGSAAAAPEVSPGHNSKLVMTVLLSDSIANPRLTSLSDKLGSQPRGAPAAFEVPERKKVKNFKRRRLCKPRQLLTAHWETKNGKLDTAQLLLSSLQSSGNESSKIDSCGKPDWWFSLMGWDTQGQMWKMLFK